MTTRARLQESQSEKLNKVIDKVLTQIFGHVATQIIYNYLEDNHSIQRHEIAQKLDSFNQALEEYLGTGAAVIEKVILEKLEPGGLEDNRNGDFIQRQKLLKLA
jgi:hypothetical protein